MVNDLLPGAILRQAEDGVILELGRGLRLHIPTALACPVKHATRYGYSRGCRCAGCTEANSAYIRSRRERLKASV